jgi:hypothetical protein
MRIVSLPISHMYLNLHVTVYAKHQPPHYNVLPIEHNRPYYREPGQPAWHAPFPFRYIVSKILSSSNDRKGDLSSRAFILHAATLEAKALVGIPYTVPSYCIPQQALDLGAGHQISSSIYESSAALSRTTFP